MSPARLRSPAVTLVPVVVAAMLASPATAQLAPPSTGGYAAFDRLLQRLTEPRRVLVIGAHPDDEDTGLLTLMSRGRGADAAYLSLSRGEGGQNGIGPELGIALGIIRTRELEAARAIDGARQYFTRAYDFGYTRSLEETERFWPPDTMLKDVVRIVRRFRPHVIVSVFSGTARDGHGQHQMAGVMARRAYEVAGDPSVYPELATEEGLAPWTPLKLYRSTRFDRNATTLTLELGGIDPRVGRTYRQIAAESRSQHRSQDFGSLQPLGPADTRLQLVEARVGAAPDADLFAAIPAEATWLTQLADSLRRHVTALTMPAALPALAAAYRRWDAERASDPALTREGDLLTAAMAVAAGLSADIRVGRPELVPGEGVPVAVEAYNAGPHVVSGVSGSIAGFGDGPPVDLGVLAPGAIAAKDVTYALPENARPSQPYFLVCPLDDALYDWSCGGGWAGIPFQETITGAVFATVDGAQAAASRDPSYRRRDQALGEIREPIRIVPRVDVRLRPAQLVWRSTAATEQTFTVTVHNNGADTATADVAIEIDGWPAPAAQRVRLEPSATRELAFGLRRPEGIDRARVTARAVARTQDGRSFSQHAELIDYPHIRATQWMREATSDIVVAPIALPAVRRVGYIRGASDRVPEALEGIGLPIELIGADTLARGDLSRYAAIVVGSRAYETDTALTAHNARLLDYAASGGHLVVQYQQYAFVRGGYAPYPLSIASPHDRITDETAPVRALVPGHPILRTPNPIGREDWDGWVQERGLYFPNEWAPEYTPLLEMQDPDRPPYRGALLIARYGRGTYIYTGISFFRELPAGVPGAFRLFLNLLAWDGLDAGG